MKYQGAKVLNEPKNPMLIDYYSEMEKLRKLPPDILSKVISKIRDEKLKKCTGCGKLLPKKNFYKRRDSRDGLQNYCKICIEKSVNKHQRRNENE